MRALQKLSQAKAEIILIDRQNYHTFIPLLYQVATGFVAPEAVTYPIRKRLRRSNVRFIQAEAKQIDLRQKTVTTESICLSYDYLVLATGSKARFLNVPKAAKLALSLRTLSDAVRIHDRLMNNFEATAVCADAVIKEQLLTIVIVDGIVLSF